jgi:hypothetical protein
VTIVAEVVDFYMFCSIFVSFEYFIIRKPEDINGATRRHKLKER